MRGTGFLSRSYQLRAGPNALGPQDGVKAQGGGRADASP